MIQTAARKHNISIDTLSWDFSVSTVEAVNILLPPKDGVYVQGLFLEGATWDVKASHLLESAPMQLVTVMPVIHFKPVENRRKLHRSMAKTVYVVCWMYLVNGFKVFRYPPISSIFNFRFVRMSVLLLS